MDSEKKSVLWTDKQTHKQMDRPKFIRPCCKARIQYVEEEFRKYVTNSKKTTNVDQKKIHDHKQTNKMKIRN